jgi:aminoglycoside 3-N-acetyltransferase
MITFQEIASGLKKLDLPEAPVIAHASLSAFGEVKGGAQTVLGAILRCSDRIMMPAFTYKTMIIPEDGPTRNGIDYGSGRDLNQMAVFFQRNMPVDRLMGEVAETLRQMRQAKRSMHPVLSFTGIGVDEALATQTLNEPLNPIGELMEENGWGLLLGVDHTVNTSIHFIERLAGRKHFTRWALTAEGIREFSGFPGCSNGFQEAVPFLEKITRRVQIGPAVVQAIPLQTMAEILLDIIQTNPLALLCNAPACDRCDTMRQTIQYKP